MADTEERQMLPEVQAYITAREDALSALRKAENELNEKYPKRHDYAYGDDAQEVRDQRGAYRRDLDEVNTKYNVSVNEAWNGLKGSSDPLVRWIGENCKEYQGEAQTVLRALPATADELEELAVRQDFCNIWDQFRDAAIAAGVMPGVTPAGPARKAVLDFVNYEAELSRNGRRRLNTLLNELVAEEAAA